MFAHSLHISSQAPALSPHATTQVFKWTKSEKNYEEETKSSELWAEFWTPDTTEQRSYRQELLLPALRATISLTIPKTGKYKRKVKYLPKTEITFV